MIINICYTKLFYFNNTWEFGVRSNYEESLKNYVLKTLEMCERDCNTLFSFDHIADRGYEIKYNTVNNIRFEFELVRFKQDYMFSPTVVRATINNYEEYNIVSYHDVPDYSDIRNKLTGLVIGRVEKEYSFLDPTNNLRKLNQEIDSLRDRITDLNKEIDYLKELNRNCYA